MGEEDVFNEGRALNMVRRMVFDKSRIDDALQEARIAHWQHGKAAVRNRVREHVYRNRIFGNPRSNHYWEVPDDKRISGDYVVTVGDTTTDVWELVAPDIARRQADVEDLVTTKMVVRDALKVSGLTPREKEAVVKRYLLDYTREETIESMGYRYGQTLDGVLRRALAKLRITVVEGAA